jgi:tetratricopeptide (TPR) repeat protein
MLFMPQLDQSCYRCGAKIDNEKNSIIFPGRIKGSYEITDSKRLCNSCTDMLDDYKNAEIFAKFGILLNEKRIKEAKEILKSVFNDKNYAHWYTLGKLCISEGSNSNALDCFDCALFLNTHYIKAWYRKGIILSMNSNFEDASKCFKNILSLDPGNTQGWNPASKFLLMFCSLEIHGKSLREGGKSESTWPEVQKWTAECVQIYSNAKEKGYLKSNSGMSEFYQYCTKNMGSILKQLEPNVPDITIHGFQR